MKIRVATALIAALLGLAVPSPAAAGTCEVGMLLPTPSPSLCREALYGIIPRVTERFADHPSIATRQYVYARCSSARHRVYSCRVDSLRLGWRGRAVWDNDYVFDVTIRYAGVPT